MTTPCDSGTQYWFRATASQCLQKTFLFGQTRDWSRVEHNATADSHDWRKLADNEPVSGEQERWLRKLQSRKRPGPRSKLLPAMERNLRNHLPRVGMEVDPAPMFQGTCRRGQ